MLPGSLRIGPKLARTQSSLSAHPIFASRSFRRRTQLPRSTKNGPSTSTPAPSRFGSATWMAPCLSFLALIIRFLFLRSARPFHRPSRELAYRAIPRFLFCAAPVDITTRSAHHRHEIHLGRVRPHEQPSSDERRKSGQKCRRQLRFLRPDLPPQRCIQELHACGPTLLLCDLGAHDRSAIARCLSSRRHIGSDSTSHVCTRTTCNRSRILHPTISVSSHKPMTRPCLPVSIPSISRTNTTVSPIFIQLPKMLRFALWRIRLIVRAAVPVR